MDQIIHPWHGGLPTLDAIERFENEKPLKERIPKSIYHLFREAAHKYHSKIALRMIMTGAEDETPISLSYTELFSQINQTANLFAELAGTGSGVAYILPTLIETQVILWAAETSGYAVPLNPLLNAEHLADLIEASKAKILVIPGPTLGPQTWEKLDIIRNRCPYLKIVAIGTPEISDGIYDYHQSIACQPEQILSFPLIENPDNVVAYFHTGGTTSAPKLVAHTHINQLTAALGTAALLDVRYSDILTNGMPMFHVGGAIVSSLAFFLSGATLLIMSPTGFRNPLMIQRFWHIVEKYKVTVLGAVPTAFSAILEHPVYGDLSHVRLAITGSAATPRTLTKKFIEQTGLSLHEILGMTESGGATAIDPAGVEATINCVGLRLPYTTISIHKRLSEGKIGDECAVNETGILVIKGPTVSPGYLNSSHGTDNIQEGLLNSGDLGYLDATGRLFLSGRSKDLIIRGGHNIDPIVIEDVLLMHPAVATAAAVGQPDAYAGERPVCYVTLKPNYIVTTAEELLEFAQKGIPERPAWPCIIHILDELPLTSIGKIYKPALRAHAALHVLKPLITEAAGSSLINITSVDQKENGWVIEVQLSSTDKLSTVKEILGQFTIATNVFVESSFFGPSAPLLTTN
ncbi:AMP-binding protein [Acinetobacter baumannii]